VTWIRIFKGAIVTMGALIVYLAFKGYRRKKERSMLFLSIGFAFITFGGVLAGVLFEVLGFTLTYIYGVESALAAVGLIVILYSIFGRS